MLPSMVRRHLYQHGWEKVTYQDLLQQNVIGKMVTSQIALAILEHATRITYGLPLGIELSKEDEAEILARHEESLQRMRDAADKVRERYGNQPILWTRDGLVRFHRLDGLPEVSVWRMVNDQWFRWPGVLACFFPYLPQHLCERLVSLDKRPQEGGNEEWIEYTDILDKDVRRFIRVDLVIEANTSITIELLESRVVQSGATVWWRHWKV
jgi:hypothetical protein